MICPFCNQNNSFVKDSREIECGAAVKRRRICESCQMRFTTIEKYYAQDLFVLKKSGVRKNFDITKVISSIKTAVRKRNVTNEQIEVIGRNILGFVANQHIVSTAQIGEKIMSELFAIDKIAYIRFASVYHDFISENDFLKFIKK